MDGLIDCVRGKLSLEYANRAGEKREARETISEQELHGTSTGTSYFLAAYRSAYLTDIKRLTGHEQILGEFGSFRALRVVPVEI